MNFFTSKNMKECIVNIDDFYGRELAYKVDIPCVSYGISEPANSFAIDIESGFDYTKFVANILDDVIDVNCDFVGKYNVSNILAGLTVAKMLGLSKDLLSYSVNHLMQIEGRFNVFNINGKKVIIDFAHTPMSIDNLLSHISNTCDLNIISLFGCVGYSDKDKREEIANVISKYSSLAIITTDNRGITSFEEISKDIILGLQDCRYECIEDRESAIRFGFEKMKESDILVIIGKGAEKFQTIGTDRISYSDKDSVLKLIN